MDSQPKSFGFYLQSHRSGKMTLRKFASEIGVTPAYISDIENSRRDPPGKELLEKMAKVLSITGPDLVVFYDLAGKGRQEVSPDLPDYIMNCQRRTKIDHGRREIIDHLQPTEN